MSTDNDDQDQVEHVDEKWLVSYADMMTLLFGLFVMLYSMAMEHEGDINAQLQKVTEETFTDKKADQPPTPVDPENSKKEIDQLKSDLSTTQLTLNETDLKKQQAETKVVDLLNQLNQLEPLILEHQLQKDKIQSLESQVQQSRSVASVPQPIEKPKDEDQIFNQRIMKEQLQNLVAQVSDSKRQLQQKDQQLQQMQAAQQMQQNQHAQQMQQNQKPTETAKSPEPPQPQARNFGLVLMKWSTKLHDLDMVIKDPNGRRFDSKHRTHSSNPGEFVLDSRTGPGAEIWQSEKLIPGQYEMEINLYQSYGNSEPAEASVSFLTPFSKAEVGKIILTEKSPTKILRFTVDKTAASKTFKI